MPDGHLETQANTVANLSRSVPSCRHLPQLAGDAVPSKKMPTGPREGDQYGFDIYASRGRAIREKMAQAEVAADDRGDLKPISKVAVVPKITVFQKRLIDAAVSIRQ